MIDPPREGVKDAGATCKKAGIKTVMITGDHIATAKAIAKDLGILRKHDLAITGVELDKLAKEDLDKNIMRYSVFARVSPEHKVRIVKAFRKTGAVVAMTGDGVNDAPALKNADIGISMGLNGTDVAKNASDMTVEAIKTQIEPQINRLVQNIVMAQTSIGITANVLPATLVWDYGINEKFDDMKKLQVMGKIQSVASIPYSYKAKIIMPILKKLIDTELLDDSMTVEKLVEQYQKEAEEIDVKFGEV